MLISPQNSLNQSPVRAGSFSSSPSSVCNYPNVLFLRSVDYPQCGYFDGNSLEYNISNFQIISTFG